jgi:hypothetical protein
LTRTAKALAQERSCQALTDSQILTDRTGRQEAVAMTSNTSRDRNTMPFTAGARPATPERSPDTDRTTDRAPDRTPDRTTDRDRGAQDRPMVTVATYPDYLSAQRAVDYLSDRKFPVDRVAIVGTDLRLVERVLGRVTVAKAALAGAGTGAWFGLLIGFLLGIFAVAAWWKVILFTVVAGVIWGALFGAIAHAMTGGRRDFASITAIQADSYSLTVDADHAGQAAQLLGQLAP